MGFKAQIGEKEGREGVGKSRATTRCYVLRLNTKHLRVFESTNCSVQVGRNQGQGRGPLKPATYAYPLLTTKAVIFLQTQTARLIEIDERKRRCPIGRVKPPHTVTNTLIFITKICYACFSHTQAALLVSTPKATTHRKRRGPIGSVKPLHAASMSSLYYAKPQRAATFLLPSTHSWIHSKHFE